jgi:hypothetical protein
MGLMRIATYYDPRITGRNDGSPLYYTNALRKLGHDVMHLTSEVAPLEEDFGKFDLHLWVDWGEDALASIMPYKPICMKDLHPSAYIVSDTHLGFDYRLEKAKEFDFVFCNQIRGMQEFEEKGVMASFLPHAVEPQAYPNTPVCMKAYDTCFVGYVSFYKRAEMLDKYFSAIPDFWYGQRLFEECAEIYRKSKIVFNTAAVDDINMRCFEATATGSFLLTEWVPTLDLCFEDGVHLVTYKTIEEAIHKAKYYLEHEFEREEIAKAGMEHTLAHHTFNHRIAAMLKMIQEGKANE